MGKADPDDTKIRTRFEAWLAARLPALGELRVAGIDRPPSAGVASDTLLIDTMAGSGPGPRLVVRVQRDVVLYPDSDLALHAHMYERVGVAGVVPVPRVYAVETDAAVLGHPFMVVERLLGQAPSDRPNYNVAGWLHDMSPQQRSEVWRAAVQAMSALHSIDAARFPLLGSRVEDDDGLRANLAHWTRYAQWCRALELPLMQQAAIWLRDHLPVRTAAIRTLSWGDARLQNLLFHGTRCTGLLDWDLVSFAGAEADLAWWALADHKNTASRGKPRLPGIGSPAETIRLWESLSGRKTLHLEWHLVFAAFRQASIAVRLAAITGAQSVVTGGNRPPFQQTAEAPIGMQWIACLLDIRLPGELTQPFVGLET